MLFFQKNIREFNVEFDNTKKTTHPFRISLSKSLKGKRCKIAGKKNATKEHSTTIRHDFASLNFIKNSFSDFLFIKACLDGLPCSLKLLC